MSRDGSPLDEGSGPLAPLSCCHSLHRHTPKWGDSQNPRRLPKSSLMFLPLTSSACSHIGGLVHAPSDCGIPENIVE